MSGLQAAAWALAACLAIGFLTWLASLARRDASIVDSLWSLMILGAALVYALLVPRTGAGAPWVLALLALWALRLSIHITWRNWDKPEDRRYQAIRARNQPHYEAKSLYLVFGLQAVLAWIVAMPVMAAATDAPSVEWLQGAGAVLALFGIAFESVSDMQLARFTASPARNDRVLDTGLWRYSRHPNYFGEFCVWWGFWLIALAAGAWWSVVSPLLMSMLLMRVSGVPMLEKDMAARRPAYRDYIAGTNAFFPGPKRQPGGAASDAA